MPYTPPAKVDPAEIWKYHERTLTKYSRIAEWLVSPTLASTNKVIYRAKEFLHEKVKLIALAYGSGYVSFKTEDEDLMNGASATYIEGTFTNQGNELDHDDDTYMKADLSGYGVGEWDVVKYDLGSVKDRILLLVKIFADAAGDGKIYVSSDDSTYTQVWSHSFAADETKTDVVLCENTRYIKFVGVNANTWQIYTIEAYLTESLPLVKVLSGANADKLVAFLSDGDAKSLGLLRVIEL